MSLENWASNRWLEKLGPDREEIERLLACADGHLDDYRKAVASEMSSDAQLSLAWDSIRASATAALRAAGYRVVCGGGEHYRTIEALEFSIDPERAIFTQRIEKVKLADFTLHHAVLVDSMGIFD
jgi:hypothetical protein